MLMILASEDSGCQVVQQDSRLRDEISQATRASLVADCRRVVWRAFRAE